MKCPVCLASWEDAKGAVCPQCAFNADSPEAREPSKLLAARESFKQKAAAYSPDTRVTRWDVIRPWISVALGFILFCLWLRACSTHGRMFW